MNWHLILILIIIGVLVHIIWSVYGNELTNFLKPLVGIEPVKEKVKEVTENPTEKFNEVT